MNNAVLQTKGLCKTYIVNKHQNNVLKNIGLTISDGELVAVMGPSGSGKSTLLYCVSGMDKVTAGEVFFNGRETAKLSDKELARLRLDEMGFIFQQMYMMKNLSILDNIIFPAVKSKKNRSSRRQTEERGRALMHRLGIGDVCGNDINEVSGGQLQRACICVTHDAKVAAKCSRVLYIVDGGIVGEKEMGHFGGGDKELRDRERELNNWLMEQGW